MALHYTISSEKTACGRTATSANATSNTADVTCKTCCKSEAFVSAAPAAVKSPAAPAPAPAAKSAPTAKVAPAAPVEPAVKANLVPKADPAPRAAAVAFEEWGSLLNSNDRLPRGKFFARKRQQRRPVRNSTARTAA